MFKIEYAVLCWVYVYLVLYLGVRSRKIIYLLSIKVVLLNALLLIGGLVSHTEWILLASRITRMFISERLLLVILSLTFTSN